MANGFPCATCGFQETEHSYYRELSPEEIKRVCGAFRKTTAEKKFDCFDPNEKPWMVEWAGYLGLYHCYD